MRPDTLIELAGSRAQKDAAEHTHDGECDCNECAMRRLIAELLTELRRVRHDLAEARTAMVRELARRK